MSALYYVYIVSVLEYFGSREVSAQMGKDDLVKTNNKRCVRYKDQVIINDHIYLVGSHRLYL